MLGVEEFFNRREVCVQNHELALRVIRLNNTSHRQDCIKREIYCPLLGLFPPLIDIHNNSQNRKFRSLTLSFKKSVYFCKILCCELFSSGVLNPQGERGIGSVKQVNLATNVSL